MIPLRVLLIEDSELDAGLILRQFHEAGYKTTSSRVDNEVQLINALKEPWDIIIADYRLPDFTATEALKHVQESGKDTPFIIVSGAIGEETAVALMKSGARDYIMKDKLSRLPPVVERELVEVEVRRSQKQALEALLESEQNLRNSQKVAHIGHWVIDLSTGKETWSDEMYRILGLEPGSVRDDLSDVWRSTIHHDDRERVDAFTDMNEPQNLRDELEYRIIRPDGSIRYILGQVGEPRVDEDGRDLQYTGVVHDITERKLMELDLLDNMKESRERASELETITIISSRMRQANTHEDLIVVILQELTRLLAANHAAFAFIDEDNFKVDFLINNGKLETTKRTLKIGSVLKDFINEGQLGFFEVIPPEVSNEIPEWAYGGASVPSSMIAFPVISESRIMGLIYLDFMTPTTFKQEQHNVVEAVAEMAGNALNRMSATSELESMVLMRERELESIYKVTSSASATLDINRALNQALELTLEAVRTDNGAIFLLDELEVSLNFIASKTSSDVSRDIFLDPSIKELVSRVVAERKALVIPDMTTGKKNKKQGIETQGLSFLGQPMRARDRVVGVLVVLHKQEEHVVLQEMTLLSFIADHLALVVENTRLYKRAERSAVLEERSRLARELHDSVTQSLYSASLYSAGARRYFSQGKAAEVDDYLSQIGNLTQQALKDMRLLVYELRSPELERNGLVGALQNRLDAVERRSNIEADITSQLTDILPERVEENLYRIAIESLNNSLKYAQATRISLDLRQVNHEVVFSVKDNGVGFIREKGLTSGGVGLATMRERAERIGGVYNILTSPEKGTTIEVRFPIKPLS